MNILFNKLNYKLLGISLCISICIIIVWLLIPYFAPTWTIKHSPFFSDAYRAYVYNYNNSSSPGQCQYFKNIFIERCKKNKKASYKYIFDVITNEGNYYERRAVAEIIYKAYGEEKSLMILTVLCNKDDRNAKILAGSIVSSLRIADSQSQLEKIFLNCNYTVQNVIVRKMLSINREKAINFFIKVFGKLSNTSLKTDILYYTFINKRKGFNVNERILLDIARSDKLGCVQEYAELILKGKDLRNMSSITNIIQELETRAQKSANECINQ